MSNNITHLKHHQIDKQAWNQAIDRSPDKCIYAYSWYLDEVSPQWEALVFGHYDAVMPLPVKRLGLFKIILQPVFTQQLGVFSNQPVTPELTQKFIGAVKMAKVKYHFHQGHACMKGFKPQTNFVLRLNHEYPLLVKQYNQNTRRNVSKTKKKYMHH